jgi:hypothetical protein
VRGLRLTALTIAGPLMLSGCLWQESWGNLDLETHSPVNEVDQCLNFSAQKESFLVKALADFYFFVI